MPNQTIAFVGFPDIKMKPVIVPDLFFSELLPLIEDLGELKLILHCFWLLNNQEGEVKFLRGDDLRNDPALLQSLGSETDLRAPRDVLEDALRRAVSRNTLLKLEVEIEEEGEKEGKGKGERGQTHHASRTTHHWHDWYFINTAKGRQTVQMIRDGKLPDLMVSIPDEARLRVERPNIFVLYEQNIGLLTPLLADQLRDLEKNFPPDWIVEAFTIAVQSNKQNLRYIQNILKRWETDGKNDRRNDREGALTTTEEQRRRSYIPDDLSDVILR